MLSPPNAQMGTRLGSWRGLSLQPFNRDQREKPASLPQSSPAVALVGLVRAPARAGRPRHFPSALDGRRVGFLTDQFKLAARRVSHRPHKSVCAWGEISSRAQRLTGAHRFCFGGFRRRTPGPAPFASMNSTPADSIAATIFSAVSSRPPRGPSKASRRLIVGIDTSAALAKSSCDQASSARAALT